jgi:hypothetical protein
MEKNQIPNSKFQVPKPRASAAAKHWGGVLIFIALGAFSLCAQTPPQIPPNAQAQLQVQQPPVDVTSPVSAAAEFDPVAVQPGEKFFYRVNVDAAESSIEWPEKIPLPVELRAESSARGQITRLQGNKFRPLTSFVYELRSTAAGRFTVPGFSVNVSGQPVQIPAATLEVNPSVARSPSRHLLLEVSPTNIFIGQPFRVRVVLPASPKNEIEALREIQFNGEGLMTDKTASRQSIETANVGGQLRPVFICEMTVTAIAPGPLNFFAQAFTAGREFTGPISIRGAVSLPGGQPNYVLLLSDVVALNVRPLPMAEELPGFTGAIGKFFFDPPQLSTNRIRVGEPVQLKIAFHGEGDLTRLVPPAAPRSRDWQIIADPPPATSFTLIPETDEATNTPAILFSYFDPQTAKYADLSIPPLPVTVIGEGLPVAVRASEAMVESGPTKLSPPATTPGKTAASLTPLQQRPWFVGLQLAPAAAFLVLWQWDRRRRFLEAHPDIVRRRQARRALRREKRRLQTAWAGGNAEAFARHAARAMAIAVAPHYPANPQALVSGDVLAQLHTTDRNGPAGDTVKKVFAAVDAQFSVTEPPPENLLTLQPAVEGVLQQLEARL